MSNKITDSMNLSDNKKIKTKKRTHYKNSVDKLLKRISSGQSGVVLEMLY